MSQLLTFSQLFSDNHQDRFFTIPDYQRPYAWESLHRHDLLQDLENLVGMSDIQAKHFSGTVVAALPQDSEQAPLDLVDGQQRLTTLVLLIARMLHVAPNLPQADAQDRFIVRHVGPGNHRYRLILNADQNTFFQKLLDGHSPDGLRSQVKTRGSKNLLDAATEFDQFLGRQSSYQIDALYEAITDRLGFLLYTPERSAEVGLMFEVINSRGKTLSDLDKVKNFLLYYAARNDMPSLTQETNRAWTNILASLHRADADSHAEEATFLHSCWLVSHDPSPRQNRPVYEGLRERTQKLDTKEGYRTLSSFIELLTSGSQTIEKLYTPHSDHVSDEEHSWLECLAHHPRKASVLPLIIALYWREDNEQKRIAALTAIEKLNFRYYVLGIAPRSDSRQSYFFRLAYDYFYDHRDGYEKGFCTEDLCEELRTFVRQHADRRRMLRHLILEAEEGWDFYQWPGLKFFLASYEQHLAREHHQTLPLGRLLASRRSDAHNDFYHREHMIAGSASEGIGEGIGQFLTRRLGNFLLLPEGANQSASDQPVESKLYGAYRDYGTTESYHQRSARNLHKEARDFVDTYRGWKNNAQGYREEVLKRFLDLREQELATFALERWKLLGADPEPPATAIVDSLQSREAATRWELHETG